jgi:hypothetical protein
MASDAHHFPIVILEDRYNGVYSKGRWIAISEGDRLENGAYRIIRCLEDGPHGDDTDAALFWGSPPSWLAVGDTPDEALNNLLAKHDQAVRVEQR